MMTERERLVELLHKAELDMWGKPVGTPISRREFIADFLLDHGVIVPPCKVGDTVYRVCKKRYDIDGYGMQWEEDWGVVTNRFHLGMLHEIGKNVFLTREEAEAALAERRRTQ